MALIRIYKGRERKEEGKEKEERGRFRSSSPFPLPDNLWDYDEYTMTGQVGGHTRKDNNQQTCLSSPKVMEAKLQHG